jgi:hypothetical protein
MGQSNTKVQKSQIDAHDVAYIKQVDTSVPDCVSTRKESRRERKERKKAEKIENMYQSVHNTRVLITPIEPVEVKSYVEPVEVKSYVEPVEVKSYVEPVEVKSYVEPSDNDLFLRRLLAPIDLEFANIRVISIGITHGFLAEDVYKYIFGVNHDFLSAEFYNKFARDELHIGDPAAFTYKGMIKVFFMYNSIGCQFIQYYINALFMNGPSEYSDEIYMGFLDSVAVDRQVSRASPEIVDIDVNPVITDSQLYHEAAGYNRLVERTYVEDVAIALQTASKRLSLIDDIDDGIGCIYAIHDKDDPECIWIGYSDECNSDTMMKTVNIDVEFKLALYASAPCYSAHSLAFSSFMKETYAKQLLEGCWYSMKLSDVDKIMVMVNDI